MVDLQASGASLESGSAEWFEVELLSRCTEHCVEIHLSILAVQPTIVLEGTESCLQHYEGVSRCLCVKLYLCLPLAGNFGQIARVNTAVQRNIESII